MKTGLSTARFDEVIFRLVACLGISALLVCQVSCVKVENVPAPLPPPEVKTATPLQRPVRLFVEQTGVTEAFKAVEVRSRVRGFIENVAFLPGAEVEGAPLAPSEPTSSEEAGSVLYAIEPDEYRVAVEAAKAQEQAALASIDVAKAQVEIATAVLERNRKDKDRQVELRKQNAVSVAEYDAALAAFQSAEGDLASAKASVDLAIAQHQQAQAARAQAELDFAYTTIRSPIDGQITKTLVKEGSLVEVGALLAEVVDTSQMYVNFSVSDREALRFIEKRIAAGESAIGGQEEWANQKVLLARENDEGFPFEGTLDYVDRQGVDVSTGTLGLRAIFNNADGTLLPGLFVRLRLPSETTTDVLLLPEKCILRDSRSTYVLVVDDAGKVRQTNITISRRMDGWALINDGLTADQQVIIEGIQKAQDGAVVKAEPMTLSIDAQWAQ